MPVNLDLEHALILRGAFAFLDRISKFGFSDAQTDQALIRWAGGPERLDPETAFDTVVQYQLFRQGGELVNRRNDNRTIYARYLPQIYGCSGNFSYTVVVPVYDAANDVNDTKPFVIKSDIALGKQDVLQRAAVAAAEWAALPDTLVGASHEDSRWEITGAGTITAAARCTDR